MPKLIKLGVLVSGRGSNLQAMIDAIEHRELNAEVGVVISNKADAPALKRAEDHGIPAIAVEDKKFKNKDEYEREIVRVLRAKNVDLVCLAGYMKIVGPVILKEFKWKVMNIHPALLPSFPGLHAPKKALEHGVKVSGCTVHFVDEGTDTGPIIAQSSVPVLEHDTEETLSERILEQEHRIYVEAVRLFAEGRIKVEGRRVKVLSLHQ